jgi:hemoglobin-like flavoprotein
MIRTIHESLERILSSERDFGALFYKTFFARVPHAKVHFEGLDMERQALVLTMALTAVVQYHSDGFTAVQKYLRVLGTRHSDRDIAMDLYAGWAKSMLETLATFHGDDWNDALALAWQHALDDAINVMFEGYQKRARI